MTTLTDLLLSQIAREDNEVEMLLVRFQILFDTNKLTIDDLRVIKDVCEAFIKQKKESDVLHLRAIELDELTEDECV